MMTENVHEQTQTTGRCLCPATWKNPVQNPNSDSKAVELSFKAARSVFLITLRIRTGCGFPWGGKDGSALCPSTNRSNNFTISPKSNNKPMGLLGYTECGECGCGLLWNVCIYIYHGEAHSEELFSWASGSPAGSL